MANGKNKICSFDKSPPRIKNIKTGQIVCKSPLCLRKTTLASMSGIKVPARSAEAQIIFVSKGPPMKLKTKEPKRKENKRCVTPSIILSHRNYTDAPILNIAVPQFGQTPFTAGLLPALPLIVVFTGFLISTFFLHLTQ
jgi:hypothetical protein